jgi:alpha-galactosidase
MTPNFNIPIQKPAILHPMQTDPLYVMHPAPNGSWVGAVELENDKVFLLGALGLEAHVALHGQHFHGWYEVGEGDWFAGYGEEVSVFARYADLLGERSEKHRESPPRASGAPGTACTPPSAKVPCTRIFDQLDDLPFDVWQVDDGWQVRSGTGKRTTSSPRGWRRWLPKSAPPAGPRACGWPPAGRPIFEFIPPTPRLAAA